MSQPTTVILNSKTLFNEDEVVRHISGHSSQFQVVITKRISKEYEKEIYSPILIQTRLMGLGNCVVSKRPAKLDMGHIPGLRRHHACFVLDACSAQCDYLVTRWPQWLALNSVIGKMKYQLRIVTPEQFLGEVN